MTALDALIAEQLFREGHDARSIAGALNLRRREVRDVLTGRTLANVDPDVEADLCAAWSEMTLTPKKGVALPAVKHTLGSNLSRAWASVTGSGASGMRSLLLALMSRYGGESGSVSEDGVD